MSGLSALKLVQAKREKGNSPQHARRQKLSTKLAEQIQLAKELLPYFAEKDIAEISNADVGNFAQKMQEKGMTPGTTVSTLV